jgi:hypothetical protein
MRLCCALQEPYFTFNTGDKELGIPQRGDHPLDHRVVLADYGRLIIIDMTIGKN